MVSLLPEPAVFDDRHGPRHQRDSPEGPDFVKRHAGVIVPLFSARRARSSWGIGELPDLAPLADVAGGRRLRPA